MKKTWLATLVCCLVTSVGLAYYSPWRSRTHARLPAISGLPYHKARKELLAAGWQPLRTKSFNEVDTDPDISSGNGPLFWRRGYIELEASSGTGLGCCAFLFNDAYGNRLRVCTAGEELPRRKAYATVTNFEFVSD